MMSNHFATQTRFEEGTDLIHTQKSIKFFNGIENVGTPFSHKTTQ